MSKKITGEHDITVFIFILFAYYIACAFKINVQICQGKKNRTFGLEGFWFLHIWTLVVLTVAKPQDFNTSCVFENLIFDNRKVYMFLHNTLFHLVRNLKLQNWNWPSPGEGLE